MKASQSTSPQRRTIVAYGHCLLIKQVDDVRYLGSYIIDSKKDFDWKVYLLSTLIDRSYSLALKHLQLDSSNKPIETGPKHSLVRTHHT